jgi:putative hemolysin
MLQLVLVGVLVLLNAAFAGTEMALVALRESQLKRLEAHSPSGATLVRLARKPSQYLATIQVGITLAGFLAAAAAAVSLAEPLEEPLEFLDGAARPVSIFVVTVVLSYLTLVFGELAPKRLAMQKAEKWALVMARPLAFLTWLTHPIVWLLSHSTDLVVRVLGGDPHRQREDVTEDELREMVATHDTVSAEQRLIIDGAFEIAERTLDQVLVPRTQVFVLDSTWSCAHSLRVLSDSGHTRAPVAPERNLDQVVGIVHMRQLLSHDERDRPSDRNAGKALQPIRGHNKAGSIVAEKATVLPIFPDSATVLGTIRELQSQRCQMALVINEHGEAEGIVTMEDLIEELVGEIYDETDPDLISVRHEPDGSIVLPGSFPMHDLVDIGVDLPEGAYTTIAGIVLAELGQLPTVGQDIEISGWRIKVRGIDARSITEVALSPLPTGEPALDALTDDEGTIR